MFNNPAALLPVIAAVLLYVTAVLIIVFHRAGLELVGMGIILLAIVWIVFDHLDVLPWILCLSGIGIHAGGRARRWWRIGPPRGPEKKNDRYNNHEGDANGH